jgi:hypothetical protein
VQPTKFGLIAALTAGLGLCGLGLAGCATTSTQDTAAASGNTVASGVTQRDLTPQEKKAIVDSVAPSLRNPNAAK